MVYVIIWQIDFQYGGVLQEAGAFSTPEAAEDYIQHHLLYAEQYREYQIVELEMHAG